MLIDPTILDNVNINLKSLDDSVSYYLSKGRVIETENLLAWSLKALTLIDLTTLAGDDTGSNVEQLCVTAAFPLPIRILDKFSEKFKHKVHTASVCVYPNRVSDASKMLTQIDKRREIGIAAVAAGFPSGQYSLKSRIEEIKYAIECGASEIDIVVNRELVLNGAWKELYNEISQMKLACGHTIVLKTILAVGECGTMENVCISIKFNQ